VRANASREGRFFSSSFPGLADGGSHFQTLAEGPFVDALFLEKLKTPFTDQAALFFFPSRRRDPLEPLPPSITVSSPLRGFHRRKCFPSSLERNSSPQSHQQTVPFPEIVFLGEANDLKEGLCQRHPRRTSCLLCVIVSNRGLGLFPSF